MNNVSAISQMSFADLDVSVMHRARGVAAPNFSTEEEAFPDYTSQFSRIHS